MLPKLEEPSIIVLDNASYHSRLEEKRPTTAWKKVDLQLWLQKNCIAFSELHKKDTLLKLCKAHYKKPVYVVDNIITAAGHDVLRLPPYHCIFNPIEMVWSQTKRFYDKDVLKSKNPLDAWNRALQNVTPEQWKSYVKPKAKADYVLYRNLFFVNFNDASENVLCVAFPILLQAA